MAEIDPLQHTITRRRLLGAAGVGAMALSNLALQACQGANHDGASAARRSRRAADHDRVSAEGTDDPAADSPAAPRDAV